MIRNCTNCAGKIRYNIEKEALVCDSCSSIFKVGDHESTDFQHYDCNEYTCNACGSKIIINETEASTFCIYCGSANVVFNRVSSENAPKAIAPFKITRKQALTSLTEAISKCTWVPKEFQNLKDTQLTAVYVPYYQADVEYDGSAVTGDLNVLSGFGRLNVIHDASTKLNDDTMTHLEPFDLTCLKPFDPDYLLGFHSNIPDLSPEVAVFRAKEKALKKANSIYKEKCQQQGYKQINPDYGRRDVTEVYDEPSVILLPVWFLTINYNNEPYTFLVNGQTGKLTGSIPTDGKKVRLTRNLLALPLLIASLAIAFSVTFGIYHAYDLREALIFFFSEVVISAFFIGVLAIASHVSKSEFTASEVEANDRLLSIFANRRQKGE
ncbi:MAG: hypothetical protein Q4E99_04705 [Bacillota bacterium]|nr:hypothetical protein [Bacillota bacterium]